jgi:outer membrane autotransporter protein
MSGLGRPMCAAIGALATTMLTTETAAQTVRLLPSGSSPLGAACASANCGIGIAIGRAGLPGSIGNPVDQSERQITVDRVPSRFGDFTWSAGGDSFSVRYTAASRTLTFTVGAQTLSAAVPGGGSTSLVTVLARGNGPGQESELTGLAFNGQAIGDLTSVGTFEFLSIGNFDAGADWELTGTATLTGGQRQAPRFEVALTNVPIAVQLGAPATPLFIFNDPLVTSASLVKGDVVNNAALVFAEAGVGVYTGGTISGPGTLTVRSGAVNLNGAHAYTGLTTVESGFLNVFGSLVGDALVESGGGLNAFGPIGGDVTVAAGGFLSGTGPLGSLTNSGRVAPGVRNAGSLAVTGDFTQTATGVLQVSVSPTSNVNTRIVAGGNAAVAGTVRPRPRPGLYVDGFFYDVVETGGTATGNFTGIEPGGELAFFDIVSQNLGDRIRLTLLATSPIGPGGTVPGANICQDRLARGFADLAAAFQAEVDRLGLDPATATPEQIRAALGNLVADPDAAEVLGQFLALTGAELPGALDAVSGVIYASHGTLALEKIRGFTEAIGGRLRRGLAASPAAVAAEGGWAGWIETYGSAGTVDDPEGCDEDVDLRLLGTAVGADRELGPGVRVGFAFGAATGRSEIDRDANARRLDVSSVDLGAYGQWATGFGIVLDGVLAASLGRYESDRRVRFGTLARTTDAGYLGQELAATATARYPVALGPLVVEPEAGLRWSWARQPSFEESGAGSLDLEVASNSYAELSSTLGLTVAAELREGPAVLRPYARAAWEHDFLDQSAAIRTSFADAPELGSYSVKGARIDDNRFTLGGGLVAKVGERVDLFADYAFGFAEEFRSHAVAAGVRLTW